MTSGISRREFLRFLWRKEKNESRQETDSAYAAVSIRRVAKVIESRCSAYSGNHCQQCFVACPKKDEALKMMDLRPVIVTEKCDGCGECQTACEIVNDRRAIYIISNSESQI